MFGYHFDREMLAVAQFHMREGKIVDKRDFFWEDLPELELAAGEEEADPGEEPQPQWSEADAGVLSPVSQNGLPQQSQAFSPAAFFSAFLKQLYLDQPYVPRTIYVPLEFPDRGALAGLLSKQSGRKVEILAPQRGDKRSLVELVGQNAKQSYDQRFRDAAALEKRNRRGTAGRPEPARNAGTHRVLRHLAHSGRGDRREHGRMGKGRDEEIRLPQVQGENGQRRR